MSDTKQHESGERDPVFSMHMAAMREMSEPRDGISPTPVSYIICCFLYILWGGWYIGHFAGDWTGTGLAERAAGPGAVAAAPQNPMVLGKEVFGSCIQCHQEHGGGVAGTTPPLVKSEYVTGDPRRLAAIVLNGLNGEFVVNGQTYNSQMPAWNIRDDEEIAAVLTYIRASWGNNAPKVTKEFVAAVRKEIETKGEWRADTLAAFAASAPPAGAAPPAAAPAAGAPAPPAAAPAK